MGRIFKNCLDMIKEIDRDLKVCGITVPVKHYQNVKLTGEDQNTKELVGVSFIISKPMLKRKEMLEFIFKDDADRIEKYCIQELADRTSGKALNPGSSWEIRQDMWQKFKRKESCHRCKGAGIIYNVSMAVSPGATAYHDITCPECHGERVVQSNKFDYTYSERMWFQLKNVIAMIKDDMNTRQAIIQVFRADIDSDKWGGDTRIPCSMDYQFLLRDNYLHCIYHMRSNDYFGHFPIDIWLASGLQHWLIGELINSYPKIKTGSLTYFCGSLHAYRWDLDKWVIF